LATTPASEREEAERQVKSRTLGNIRLIAELFNKGIVAERIVTVCIEELLGDIKADPVEDNVEVCLPPSILCCSQGGPDHWRPGVEAC